MKIFRHLIISIILIVIITTGAFLYLWMDKGVATVGIPQISSDLKIEGVHLTRAVAGTMEWELRAKSADYFREKGVTHLELPKVVFYGKGDIKVELEGDRGEIFNYANDVVVSGNVRAISSDGYIFQADSLRYLSEKKVVTTESKVSIKGKGLEIEGVGMSADIEQGRVFIKRGVKAVLEGN